MALRVFNTLTRRKEDFTPREPARVGMYVCGPTVYNYIHVGNARTYLSFDVIYRYLKYGGHDVVYVRNITDVEDKIINKAKEEGVEPAEIAERFTRAFHEDAKGLGLAKPTVEPKATEHIREMISIIKRLIEKDLAYAVDGDVYFEVTKFPGYGKLANRTLEDMRAGERVDVDPRKRHPMDFALWKSSKPGEPHWDSPWGTGRPGWHIECSAMSEKYLGMGFDIHGGGQDLIFPHHENEIAQSEGASAGGSFVKYWLHGGMVNIGEEKMAKSLGNVILVRDLLAEHGKDVLRLLALSTHYRSPIDFGPDKIKEATAAYDRVVNAVRRIERRLDSTTASSFGENPQAVNALSSASRRAREEFGAAMDDDFNTAAALASIFELVKEINMFLEGHDAALSMEARDALEDARGVLFELTGALGLEIKLPEEEDVEDLLPEAVYTLAAEVLKADVVGASKRELIDQVLALREVARSKKDWVTADFIRKGLVDMGIEIEDTPAGPEWRIRGK
ncbi:MAG: cysteine--tRNA ligase [Actinobacteria bacterium]|nr:cysteine--tRNA ligase [Actinomycetota bacterium]